MPWPLLWGEETLSYDPDDLRGEKEGGREGGREGGDVRGGREGGLKGK